MANLQPRFKSQTLCRRNFNLSCTLLQTTGWRVLCVYICTYIHSLPISCNCFLMFSAYSVTGKGKKKIQQGTVGSLFSIAKQLDWQTGQTMLPIKQLQNCLDPPFAVLIPPFLYPSVLPNKQPVTNYFSPTGPFCYICTQILCFWYQTLQGPKRPLMLPVRCLWSLSISHIAPP